jgi:thiol:disulfide interchange protein DsbD
MSRISAHCLVVLAFLCVGTAFGQNKDPFDSFDQPQSSGKSKGVDDPFAEANRLQQPAKAAAPGGKAAESGKGQGAGKAPLAIPEQNRDRVPDPLGDFDRMLPKFAKKEAGIPKVKPTNIDDRVDLEVTVSPDKVRRGEVFKLTIKGSMRPGYHTDPMTKRAATDDQPASGISRLRYGEMAGLQPLAPIEETGKAEFDTVKGVGTKLVYEGTFSWSQDILVLPDCQPGPRKFRITLKMQACNNSTCIPADVLYDIPIQVSDEPAIALTAALEKRMQEVQPPPTAVPLPGAQAVAPAPGNGNAAKADLVEKPEAKRQTLLGMILLSMAAALAMLCTPCVFPMIPITVSICLKQSQREHHNALLTAAVYSLTIIIMLTASILLLGGLVVAWANNVWLNLVLGVVMVYFALSLFGMYDIELPRGLARFTNSREDKGGYVGIIFMALTFTITSFTCTGPFLGPLLVAAKETGLSFGDQLISALAYSATFAAPFFVLALFPSLAKKLPKSGGWLNAVKVVMGFIELALAFKFLSNSDLAFNPGRPVLFNYETVLCAWIGLSLACGLYLLGIFRLPHDSPVEHLSVPRMLLAGMFLSFAIYITPALWRVVPQGVIGNSVVAFLPLDTRARPGETEWLRDYELAYKEAAEQGKLIFIDFTGQNCTNCRYNEKNVFVLPEVQQELKKYVRVQLYTDVVPDPKLSTAQAESQGTLNNELREHTFNDVANPLYAIIRPRKGTGPYVEKNGVKILAGADLNRVRKGLINEAAVKDFVDFLQQPLQNVAGGPAGNDGVKIVGK